MNPGLGALLVRLADGRVRTRDALARECGISVAGLDARLDELRRMGAPLDPRLPSDSVGLRWPLELLDAERIRSAGLPQELEVSVALVTGSTNRDLSEQFDHRRAVLAEFQHGGRGRRGRSWHSPLAAGLWLSYGFEFGRGPAALGPLALVAGIAVVDALGEARVRLKWPNDLIADGRKLGGVLVELKSVGAARTRAVIGIGVNARLPDHLPRPESPWIDLHGLRVDATAVTSEDQPIPRNRLAARLLSSLDAACREFSASGFQPFSARWCGLDALRGRAIEVWIDPDRVEHGVARGIDESGALRVALDGGTIRAFNAGEVRVRRR